MQAVKIHPEAVTVEIDIEAAAANLILVSVQSIIEQFPYDAESMRGARQRHNDDPDHNVAPEVLEAEICVYRELITIFSDAKEKHRTSTIEPPHGATRVLPIGFNVWTWRLISRALFRVGTVTIGENGPFGYDLHDRIQNALKATPEMVEWLDHLDQCRVTRARIDAATHELEKARAAWDRVAANAARYGRHPQDDLLRAISLGALAPAGAAV